MRSLCRWIVLILLCHKGFLQSTTTTISLIKDYGYPHEEHNVTTEDGYIISLFRIPYSPNNKGDAAVGGRKPVVYLMHGFGQSSADWVMTGSPRALGLLLSDMGYDVWLGNARGTRYSKKSVEYSSLNPLFWRFSWHEIGIYDLPASINYIRNLTSSPQVQYIGHSQGTTAFFVAASTVASFNEKIKSAHLLAPVAFISHATTIVIEVLALLFGLPNPLAAIGGYELLINTRFVEILSEILCSNSSPLPDLCLNLTHLLYGEGSKFTNKSALETFFETVPEGVCSKQLFHFLQLYNSGKFRQFDYGFLENYNQYKQFSPPDYELNQIKAPLFLYHSENDALASPSDVQKLVESLPPAALRKVYKLPYESWNHIDFILANYDDELFYSTVTNDLQKE